MDGNDYMSRIKALRRNPLSVFLSYAHENAAHRQWVSTLAFNIQHNGCEVLFDQHERRENPADLMVGGVCCNTVIIVMTPTYYHRSFADMSEDSFYDGWAYDEFDCIKRNFEKINRVVTVYRSGDRCFSDFPIIDFSNDETYGYNLRSLLAFVRLSAMPGKIQLPKLLLNPVFFFVDEHDEKSLAARHTPLATYPRKALLKHVVFTRSTHAEHGPVFQVGGREK